jgi:hypothetical protein
VILLTLLLLQGMLQEDEVLLQLSHSAGPGAKQLVNY